MTTNKKKVLIGGAALTFLLVVGMVAVKPVLGASGFWNSVVERVSDKIAGDVLGDKSDISTDEKAFGAANSVAIGVTGGVHFNNISIKDSNSDVTLERWIEYGTIGSSTSTFLDYTNNKPGFTRVVGGGIQLMGTTSATTKFIMGTSTVSIAPAYNATIGTTVPNGLLAVHSATTTVNDSFDFVYNAVVGRTAGAVASSTQLTIPQGMHIIGYMTTGASDAISGQSVTSTAGRGFIDNSYYWLEFERVATST